MKWRNITMLHIALCDDNPASIEILEKYFDILNDSTIDYDVYLVPKNYIDINLIMN